MSTAQNESLVPGRECGECRVCCIALTVDKPDIQKMPSSACCHLTDSGCGIYQTRFGICRSFYCGWRSLAALPGDWRPDQSGILVIGEANELPQFRPMALTLFVTGNPLKTMRRPDFLDFIIRNVRNHVALYLMLPGPKSMKSARLPLNSPLRETAAHSRSDVKAMLERALKEHLALPPTPHVMENSGNDVST